MRFKIGTGLVIVTMAFASCKPAGSSSLNDAATTSSFKTGFFLPKSQKEYSLRQANVTPWTTEQFMARFRQLTNTSQNVKLWKPDDGTDYAVSATGSGEQVLVTYTKVTDATPVMSITPDNKVWDWGPYIITKGSKIAITELFVRRPYVAGEQPPIDLTVNNMYVRRQAMNVDGSLEPVMVPWLSHVSSENGSVIVFRMGNTILDGFSGKPMLEFRKISVGPAWVVMGVYKDNDVKAGTVFWKYSPTDYYSVTPGQANAVKWHKQDDDSLDRVGTVPLAEARQPADVDGYLKSAGTKVAEKQVLLGFDWLDGESSVIQLERTDKTFGKVKAGASLSLTGAANAEKDDFTDEDYKKSFGLRSWGAWWAGEEDTKPVRTIDSGTGYKGVVFTDQTGQQRGGAMLSERNDPNGNKIYTVMDRSTNEVRQVSADGRVLGSPISATEYKQRAEGNVERMNTMRENGELAASDASAIRTAQGLDARAARQLERSESLVPGSTAWEMAGGQLRKIGVSAVTAEAKDKIKDATGNATGTLDLGIDKALIGEASRTLDKGAPDTVKRAGSDSQAMLVDMGKEVSKGYVPKGPAQDAAGVAIDTGVEGVKRFNQGDFSSSNPDLEFDRAVSGAAIAGTAVSGTVGSIVKQGIPEGTTGRAAAGDGMKNYTGTLFNSAEAYSRASYAETLSKQASESLDQRIEMRQVNGAYQGGLNTLSVLEAEESPQPNYSQPQQAPQSQESFPVEQAAPSPSPEPVQEPGIE